MNIACAIDTTYIRHCAVMLRSLWESNQREDINVYILHGCIDAGERASLAAYLGSFLPSVSFLQVNSNSIGDFPVFGHISLVTYFRLLLPAALPAGIERVIYLDCHLLVVRAY